MKQAKDKKGRPVKFIRKNGKVIPIRAKGPSGGKKRPSISGDTKVRMSGGGTQTVRKIAERKVGYQMAQKHIKKGERKSMIGAGLFVGGTLGAFASAGKSRLGAIAGGAAAIAGVGGLMAGGRQQKVGAIASDAFSGRGEYSHMYGRRGRKAATKLRKRRGYAGAINTAN